MRAGGHVEWLEQGAGGGAWIPPLEPHTDFPSPTLEKFLYTPLGVVLQGNVC